ncbi:MAG: AAA family ATPase [Candidatus Altiarchaeota archaeon]
MRLTRLELKGFKSFREKTVLEYPDKFMGIVGPNGSGKSNITEAICFVLGKSRGLRAANLQELIFNGGIGGQPAQKAVVAITLKDNSGQRHRICRIVDRDGNSQYKLDDKRTTRQHVMEIVGDSEYNIILQDDITKVVEMKPKDRRRIIDDLCGIGIYDEKRDKALGELEKVEERISQTHIILGEKQGYMHELRKERDEALKYLKVRDELRSSKATILYKDITSFERRSEKIEAESAELKKGREEALKRISDVKSDIGQQTDRLKAVNSEIIRLEEEKKGTKITEVRGEIARHEDRVGLFTKQLEALVSEESDKKDNLSLVLAQNRENEALLNECGVRHSAFVKEVESEAKKTVDSALESELDVAKNRVFEARSSIKAIRELNQKKLQEAAALKGERESIEAKMKACISEEQGVLKDAEKYQLENDQSLADFKRFEGEYDLSNNSVNDVHQRLEGQRILLTRKQSELSTILRASGGMQHAVRAVVGLKKVIPGIFGPVSQLGQVKDRSYELALQVAAGSRMQYVVVSSVNDAAKCIDYLRQKKIGRCTFLPLDKVKSKTTDKAPKDSLGFARDHVQYSSKFSTVFEYVFGDTILVKDIETAKRIGIGEWRMATLDGDLLELSGAMTGGHVGERYEITFSNIEELERETAALESSVASLEAEYEEKVASRKKLDASLMMLRERIRKSKEGLDASGYQNNLSSERRSAFRASLNKAVDSLSALEREMQDNAVEITKLERTASAEEKSINELAERRNRGAVTKVDSLKDALRDLEVQKTKLTEKAGFLKQQAEQLKARLAEIAPSRDMIEGEIKSLEGNIHKLRFELDGLEKAHHSVHGEIAKLIEERGNVEVQITELSSRIGETERGMEGAAQRLQDYMVEKATINTRLDDLRREYGKYEGVALIEKAVKELTDLAEKLERDLTAFGSVNLRSVETYEVIKKEFDEINAKLDTLKSERQSIFDFMDKIESKKRDTFMEAFDKVKANFERIYAQLADGKGTLILDNPMNISESGLIITASPGGKRVMSLDAMSGGEKVLTSSAFLLGLQQYKPAYFYIVDELDAALDKRNSSRLAEMLAASSSQFLMVTHNMNMLKYMDSAIGVSMTNGSSQIVGVRFSAEKQAPIETALPKEEAGGDVDADELEPVIPEAPTDGKTAG